ncbi:hypothetical protein [Halovivax asiaticus]|uniref:hypothetical protein n=1 Tax=Halovivax asiaticus TaxID=332953 RepID=UPI00126725EA|nr:hypothetical protein [Halovivax asiaticus]
MTNQKQTKLGAQNSILSAARVRRLSPEQLGISAPGQQSDQIDDSDQGEKLHSAAVDAVGDDEDGIGAAVLTSDETLHTGIPIKGEGWGTHAIELAVSKAVSNGADGISSVAVYSVDGQSGLCGRCLQALADTRDGEVTIEVLSSEGFENSFELTDLTPWVSQS